MKAIFDRLLIATFLFAIFVPSIGIFFSQKQNISTSEKRSLSSFPEFHWSPTSNRRFKKAFSEFRPAFEKYISDHFFLRPEMVTLNSLIKFFLFQSSPHFMALVGKDNWLFYMGDGEFHDYLRNDTIPGDQLQQWNKVIAQRREWIESWGGKYLIAIAPNKSHIYEELLPTRIRLKKGTPQLTVIDRHLASGHDSGNFLNLHAAVESAKRNGHVYYQFDTHWTDLGAFAAYQEIIGRLKLWFPDINPVGFQQLEPKVILEERGDLSLIIGLIDFLDESITALPLANPCAEVEKPFSNSQAPPEMQLTKSGCAKQSSLRVIIVGDSFVANIRKYFAETFSEVIFSEEKEFWDLKEFIASYKPDIIIHLHVARFMQRACVLEPDPT